MNRSNRPSRRSLAIGNIALECAGAQHDRVHQCHQGDFALALLEGRIRSNIALLMAMAVQLGIEDRAGEAA